ncbi:hypothetical protein GCM10027280_46010 [Micromonospora polyrhachis]|uniref:Uncharacterized protein n=1 Tax=Micromonospora polyrhachis TaxID=1282883 RepID=A0A7W7SQV1_9ACTN|nr:hypothetical protein [Micromonospora polyrhachis]MBB4958886.1 hypothetical protein [Micromonospora polyrhachis]
MHQHVTGDRDLPLAVLDEHRLVTGSVTGGGDDPDRAATPTPGATDERGRTVHLMQLSGPPQWLDKVVQHGVSTGFQGRDLGVLEHVAGIRKGGCPEVQVPPAVRSERGVRRHEELVRQNGARMDERADGR